jgi:tetratricopeptide (TPR) repeat protein
MKSILSLVLAFAAASALAVDMTPMAEPEAAAPVDKLAAARKQIQAKRWPDAIAELKRLNDSGNADWNNLMGYALRKQAVPDLVGAERHYEAALRIAPAHRGALEYAGELSLMKGDLAKAEQRAVTLARACASACEEYADLKRAIERYKAAGNKFVSAP